MAGEARNLREEAELARAGFFAIARGMNGKIRMNGRSRCMADELADLCERV